LAGAHRQRAYRAGQVDRQGDQPRGPSAFILSFTGAHRFSRAERRWAAFAYRILREALRSGKFGPRAVREALEGTAAALAAVHATKAELQLMVRIAAKEAHAGNDPDKLVTINGELHQTFYKASHNRYLLQSVTTVVDALGLLRHSTFVLPGSAELAHREHLQIIKAIRTRNPAAAKRLARQHVRHALAMRLKLPGGRA
jgi:hypothetical protein